MLSRGATRLTAVSAEMQLLNKQIQALSDTFRAGRGVNNPWWLELRASRPPLTQRWKSPEGGRLEWQHLSSESRQRSLTVPQPSAGNLLQFWIIPTSTGSDLLPGSESDRARKCHFQPEPTPSCHVMGKTAVGEALHCAVDVWAGWKYQSCDTFPVCSVSRQLTSCPRGGVWMCTSHPSGYRCAVSPWRTPGCRRWHCAAGGGGASWKSRCTGAGRSACCGRWGGVHSSWRALKQRRGKIKISLDGRA